ncbi:MAG: GlsB/YeaQ/YmgE family stress response membrane protein [Magnetospirillum sp.]|nr:GlsB/YeaQ/YmgE family stress response membrane protein [Magnetospirillum sp.]
MSILAWLLLGLIAGFIANKIVTRTREGLFLDIVLGIVGALVGGSLFSVLGGGGITGFNLWSPLVAIIGAVVALLLYHAVIRHSPL